MSNNLINKINKTTTFYVPSSVSYCCMFADSLKIPPTTFSL